MDGEHGIFFDETFAVRSYESGISDRVTLPTLCNYMQEAAGMNAEKLGWGIRTLQSEGLTWMLSRLRMRVSRYVSWGETVRVRTWPSGMKGRLLALRCFRGFDSKGEELFRASSEWLYVNLAAQKIAKLPESFAEVVPEGTPAVELGDLGAKFPRLPGVSRAVEVTVRRSDLDFNDHANNVRYVEWMLESLPEETFPAEIDVVFRSAAKAGDVLSCDCFEEAGRTAHAIRRLSDGQTLATGVMAFA